MDQAVQRFGIADDLPVQDASSDGQGQFDELHFRLLAKPFLGGREINQSLRHAIAAGFEFAGSFVAGLLHTLPEAFLPGGNQGRLVTALEIRELRFEVDLLGRWCGRRFDGLVLANGQRLGLGLELTGGAIIVERAPVDCLNHLGAICHLESHGC